jgi:hypothetical protein
MNKCKTEQAVALVKELKALNDARQEKLVELKMFGCRSWHACETVDDKLFQLLTLLGD